MLMDLLVLELGMEYVDHRLVVTALSFLYLAMYEM
jgi:hypothetical protein